jgi:integrase
MNVAKAVLDQEKCAQIEKILHERHPRYGLLWALGIFTGLRISDLLSLKVQDTKTKLLHIREKKTGKERLIELEPEMLERIRHYVRLFGLQKGDFLFFSAATRTHKPISRQWFNIILTKAGLHVEIKHVSAHSMRKTTACEIFRSTGQIEHVRKILNHKHKSTTEIYLQDLLKNPSQEVPKTPEGSLA